MIHASLSFLRNQVNSFITIKDPLNTAGSMVNAVVLTNIVDQENHLFHPAGDFIFMTLINTEEETVGKSQLPYLKTPDDKLHVVNPDIKLNLYIQFSGFSDSKLETSPGYERALRLLDQVVLFFQFTNVFNNTQYPALLTAGIEKLILEPVSLTFEQLNHLWATLGAKYMPSVIYKCRMLIFRETIVSPVKPLIKELSTDEMLL
jgi:hypothetical protein